jgi:hypothetical protein
MNWRGDEKAAVNRRALDSRITDRAQHPRHSPPKWRDVEARMVGDWNFLSEDLQLVVSREAMRHAAETIAGQAELLAEEMEAGVLCDRGGPEALRLFAAVLRAAGGEGLVAAGKA